MFTALYFGRLWQCHWSLNKIVKKSEVVIKARSWQVPFPVQNKTILECSEIKKIIFGILIIFFLLKLTKMVNNFKLMNGYVIGNKIHFINTMFSSKQISRNEYWSLIYVLFVPSTLSPDTRTIKNRLEPWLKWYC